MSEPGSGEKTDKPDDVPGEVPPVGPYVDYQSSPAGECGMPRFASLGIGLGISVVAIVAGGWLTLSIGSSMPMLIGTLGALALVIYLAVVHKSGGFVIGFILAPFVIIAALVLLVGIICGTR